MPIAGEQQEGWDWGVGGGGGGARVGDSVLLTGGVKE